MGCAFIIKIPPILCYCNVGGHYEFDESGGNNLLSTPIGQFRLMGFLEGLSLLILLFIAMPLKYLADLPEVVTIVGTLHGLFFIMYLIAIAYVTFKIRWSFVWITSAFAVAFIPFGNIILDVKLRRSRYM